MDWGRWQWAISLNGAMEETLGTHSSVGVPRLQKQYWILALLIRDYVGNTKEHCLRLPGSRTLPVSVRETNPPGARKRLTTDRDALAAP